jgi:hypothetical protein
MLHLCKAKYQKYFNNLVLVHLHKTTVEIFFQAEDLNHTLV